MRVMLLTLGALAILLLGAGCGSACGAICENDKECFNANRDVGACTTACEAGSEDNSSYQQKIDECADCRSSRTCAEILAECIDDCWGVRLN